MSPGLGKKYPGSEYGTAGTAGLRTRGSCTLLIEEPGLHCLRQGDLRVALKARGPLSHSLGEIRRSIKQVVDP